MIIDYKVNMAGPYHIKNNIPCQDSWAIQKNQKYVIAACADGLGSEEHSDIGSRVAAKTVTTYCEKRISADMNEKQIIKIMEEAFAAANNQVYLTATNANHDPDQYDTTLCLAIYDGESLYYGQSGDSGIIALLDDGSYIKVTEQQRDEDGYVFPLCFGAEYWEFGKVHGNVAGVMIMTDGVFEQLCPPILKNTEEVINISLAEKFLNHFNIQEEDIKELELAANEYLKNYPSRLLDDDKTAIVLLNTNKQPERRESAYYMVPDWKHLKCMIEKSLYKPQSDIQEETSVNISMQEKMVKMPVNNKSSEAIDEKKRDI